MNEMHSQHLVSATAHRENGQVVVAILTYRRPVALVEALDAVCAQAVELSPPAIVVVVDNDPQASAREVVSGLLVEDADQGSAHVGSGAVVHYRHEPTPGIAAARNLALRSAFDLGAEALVFIDDDEVPDPRWLVRLVATWRESGADAVAGPVRAIYPDTMDSWLRAGEFFDRRRLPTGREIPGAATNNLLLDLTTLRRLGLRFDNAFGLTGGEDTMLTRALTSGGGRILWCDEATVSEVVAPERMSRSWVLRRAFRSGNVWGRVALRLTPEGASAALSQRAALTARAGKRTARGVSRTAVGVLRRDEAARAKGAGDIAAGLGLAGSVVGYVYGEYRRPK